ncbi:MAG: hypothetical protein ACE5HT_03875 [Gemmatimonadales bacterium]
MTDRSGRYRLRSPNRDSTASYLVSVQHDGIGYFSTPLTGSAAENTANTLYVYDTSSVEPEILLTERHFIVRSAQEDGSRRVIELIVLRNPGSLTRIARDTSDPVWEGAIPSEAVQFELGESDLSVQAIYRRGDSVAIAAPMPPGEKQIIYGYVVPRSVSKLILPLDHAAGRVNVMLQDTSASVTGGTLALRGVEELDDVFFRRYGADSVPRGSRIEVHFAATRFSANSLWWLVVAAAGVTLLGALIWWLRSVPQVTSPASDPDVLALQIATLDAEFEQLSTPTRVQQESYHKRRAELKGLLNRALSSQGKLD